MAVSCPSCSADLLSTDRFCRACGASVAAGRNISDLPTGIAPPGVVIAPGSQGDAAGAGVFVSSPVGRLISSSSVAVGGFAPGTVLAGRYRIIGLLGRGGMGEVYRADDLKLGQAVALKFLPKALADDPVRRERFFAEVRIARQVSHPNICRVYDIGEIELGGPTPRHFLTMEYVDGEDLASLLKRIGHLHGTKALDIARQLCAGLSAAHDKGVLHRDLKPANVMLDGRGPVRITDFGLAVAAGDETPASEVSGTPAYMAPEQFAGRGSSVRSDVYALGLVLYELYTGRRAFEAATIAELREMKEVAPAAPSVLAAEIDPVIERVILRCLEKDPRQRPSSAAQVAAALPGGDPLAAALAAGETPSPDMVAASGSKDGLRPIVAWACLALFAIGLAGAILFGRRLSMLELLPFDKSPEALGETARAILHRVGQERQAADRAFGFVPDRDFASWVRRHDRSASRWDHMPDSAMQFWYRESPRPIVPTTFPGMVTLAEPVPVEAGESSIALDVRGRLVSLRIVPPTYDAAPAVASTADWSALFEASGLDLTRFVPDEPRWTPPTYADARAAWAGTAGDVRHTPLRVEAASYRGKPISWQVLGPWVRQSAPHAGVSTVIARVGIAIGLLVAFLLLAGGLLFARRNVRTGRGDRRGATRLACAVLAFGVADGLLNVHHVVDFGEIDVLAMVLGITLLASTLIWIFYVAAEPFVRRHWPQALVSWSRILSGTFRDPVVGRDVLIGCVWSGAMLTIHGALTTLSALVGYPPVPPRPVNPAIPVLDLLIYNLSLYVLLGLGLLLLLFIFRLVLRRQWAAVALLLLLAVVVQTAGAESPIASVYMLIYFGGMLFVMTRFGLVAVIVGLQVSAVFQVSPITTQFSAWYSGTGMLMLAYLAAIAVFGFYTSLGGQPLFGRLTLDD